MEMRSNKEDKDFKDVELRSAEVNEIMNRMPPAILRWGNTVLAVIVAGLIVACCYVKWPETEYTAFIWKWNSEDSPQIIVSIPAVSIRIFQKEPDKKISLTADIFGDIDRLVVARIDSIFPRPDERGYYKTFIHLDNPSDILLVPFPYETEGTAFYIKTEKSLGHYIYKSLLSRFNSEY